MVSIHCALVQGYLLAKVVGSEASCNWTGTCIAPGGVVLENFVGVGLYVVWVTWKASNTGKHILIFVQEIFFSIEKGAVCHVHHTVIPST